MAARGAASTLGDAVARAQTTARRAGAAWNRHDTAAVRANLEIARELRVPRLLLDYGGLRFRFDFLPWSDLAEQAPAVAVQVEGGGDVQMEDGQPAGGPDSDAAVAPPPSCHGAAGTPSCQGAIVDAAELGRLQQRAATATARRQRQKAARRARNEAARLLAAQAASGAPEGDDGEAPRKAMHCPLWSTTMDQEQAWLRLLGEVTGRCATVARERGLSTRAISLPYGGRSYSVSVLTGTEAVVMPASRGAAELLALLGAGLTEESLTALLERWSKPVVASGFPVLPAAAGVATAAQTAASTEGPAASGLGSGAPAGGAPRRKIFLASRGQG